MRLNHDVLGLVAKHLGPGSRDLLSMSMTSKAVFDDCIRIFYKKFKFGQLFKSETLTNSYNEGKTALDTFKSSGHFVHVRDVLFDIPIGIQSFQFMLDDKAMSLLHLANITLKLIGPYITSLHWAAFDVFSDFIGPFPNLKNLSLEYKHSKPSLHTWPLRNECVSKMIMTNQISSIDTTIKSFFSLRKSFPDFKPKRVVLYVSSGEPEPPDSDSVFGYEDILTMDWTGIDLELWYPWSNSTLSKGIPDSPKSLTLHSINIHGFQNIESIRAIQTLVDSKPKDWLRGNAVFHSYDSVSDDPNSDLFREECKLWISVLGQPLGDFDPFSANGMQKFISGEITLWDLWNVEYDTDDDADEAVEELA
jgi:hypothetical protein